MQSYQNRLSAYQDRVGSYQKTNERERRKRNATCVREDSLILNERMRLVRQLIAESQRPVTGRIACEWLAKYHQKYQCSTACLMGSLGHLATRDFGIEIGLPLPIKGAPKQLILKEQVKK